MQITFVYRPTRVFTTCLHAKAISARTRVCVCYRVSTVNDQENLKPTIKYNAFIHVYRIEGNIGGGKLWRIWRMTISSPKFNPPTFSLE